MTVTEEQFSAVDTIVDVNRVSKTYANDFTALNEVNLQIKRGEILALLGPNGAGKTTLISIICGIVKASAGKILVDGYDINKDFRKTRSLIGLVPQELHTDAFESVWSTVSFSRGLYGKPKNPAIVEKVLKALSLYDKKDQMIMTLSGGMKRRVLIAKALAHEPQVLFLDEPTAGVDVELRKDMWKLVHQLREEGVTIILTTHYIEEAEEIADRIGVINNGEIILVEEKNALMRKLGKRQLILKLTNSLSVVPSELHAYNLERSDDGNRLTYTYSTQVEHTSFTKLLDELRNANIEVQDVTTKQTRLEEIFVELVKKQ